MSTRFKNTQAIKTSSR